MSPTQRTLNGIRRRGYVAGVVERWLRFAGEFGKRQDLFGIIDVIAINENETLGIQSCGNSFAKHFKELVVVKNQQTYDWLLCPSRRLEIWAWRKVVKKRGSGVKIWQPKIQEITLEDLDI